MTESDEPIRDDHAELLRRRALTEDAARPDAVARRHAGKGRTARENVEDLVDAGSFVEYGRFTIAAQRFRRDLADLIARTPADGLIAGTARINGDLFGDEGSACAVLSYDYTVLAGTQGALGHRKKDRLFEIIERMRLPTVFFAEGGGGRPGDTDYPVVSALDARAFKLWAALSGLVPRIAIVKGRCFAGNAVIAGCSDLIVATEDASIGMGGPAMIAGGGLGDVHPDDVGPISMQEPNGVVDIVVAAIIAVAFGVIFWAWNLLWYGPADAIPLPGRAFMYGVWLVPAVLGGLIIRKPGAAFFTETVAALVSIALGSAWEAIPEPKKQFVLQIVQPAGIVDTFRIGPHTPTMKNEDVALLHRLWLNITREPGLENVHHHDILTEALTRFAHDYGTHDHESIVKELGRHGTEAGPLPVRRVADPCLYPWQEGRR